MFRRADLFVTFTLVATLAVVSTPASAQFASFAPSATATADNAKIDDSLQQRQAANPGGRSDVIVKMSDPSDTATPPALAALLRVFGAAVNRRLSTVNAITANVPNGLLVALSNIGGVGRVSFDRPIAGAMERTGATVGATAVRQNLGYDGFGVGVAIIDSGVAPALDDLTDASGASQRIDRFVDFVNGNQTPYDDYGHGTHVAGIVAGNGFDSSGARSGIAPGARLTVLKVLDSKGNGRISDVIAALDYVVAHKNELNIRVVNLSVAAGVYESYNDDPLTLAAREVTRAGIVVVAASGNRGRASNGHTLYGGISAPGNAPWVLTVGASSHMGTIDRSDDQMAAFSSRGPAAVNYIAKPDLVAPGVGIESLSNPDSALYTKKSAYLLDGTIPKPYHPYLSLSGSSMASPVVAGTVALMLQANPLLAPNAVKAILQYTAQVYPNYDPLSQGAGFLNAKAAVELARYLLDPVNAAAPDSQSWSRRLIWGTRQYQDGSLDLQANAWSSSVDWGAPDANGSPVAWGTLASLPWTIAASSRNVVWGRKCGGNDCSGPWTVAAANSDSDTVVWGTSDNSDTVVWGTSDDSDTVVWGTSCDDITCEPIVWGAP